MKPAAGSPQIDRAAAVRRAMRSLVAERGFHGASMSAVAAEAGVATGTAYVHYPGKDALVLATYLEVKRDLGCAAVVGVDPGSAPKDGFMAMWLGVHRHLAAEPERARFLVQVDGSPYARQALEMAMGEGDDLPMNAAASPDMASVLAPLPREVLYDLSFGVAVRIVAGGIDLQSPDLLAAAEACWRAVTVA